MHDPENCWLTRWMESVLPGASFLVCSECSSRKYCAQVEQAQARLAELNAEGEIIAAKLAQTRLAMLLAGIDPSKVVREWAN